jgi:hypothetical protein
MDEGTFGEGGSGVLRIECDTCIAQHSDACDDCLVTHLCGHDDGDAVVVQVSEVRALRMLQGAGLAPELRHRRRTG